MASRTNPQGDLRDFLAAARSAVAESNWYAAIALALTLPDICASIDRPGSGITQGRYVEWWEERAAGRFWIKPDDDEDWTPRSLVPGKDAFLLRCAFLHNGTGTTGKTDPVKERFRFMAASGGSYGQSRDEREVSLNVEYFVEAVCRAVEQWIVDRQDDAEAQARLTEIVGIIPSAMTVVDYTRHEDHERCQSAKAAGRAEVLVDLDALLTRLGEGLETTETGGHPDVRTLEMWWKISGWVRERRAKAERELQDVRQIVGRL